MIRIQTVRIQVLSAPALLIVLLFSSCSYIPEEIERPLFEKPTWKESRDHPRFAVSPELAAALDGQGIPATLRFKGMLTFVESTSDDTGAGCIESMSRLFKLLRDKQESKATRVSKLNQLVYDDQDYKFLRLSVSYWRKKNGDPGRAGFYLMSPREFSAARRGKGCEFVRAEQAMTWDKIQPIPTVSKRLDEYGAEGKKDRLAGRLVIKRLGEVNSYIAANALTDVDFFFDLPLDLVNEVLEKNSTVLVNITLGQAFMESRNPDDPMLVLNSTIALRNPVIGNQPMIEPGQRTHRKGNDRVDRVDSVDRLYTKSILLADLKTLLNARRKLLDGLEAVVNTPDFENMDEWRHAIKVLGPMHANLGNIIMEASPNGLAHIIPAARLIQLAEAHKVVPDGEVAVFRKPDGSDFTVKTGDVALRLGTSRQIAVGTFPLPKKPKKINGFVDAMNCPGKENSFTILRAALSHPSAQEKVKGILMKADVWDKISEPIRNAIKSKTDKSHPFLNPADEEGNKVFLTALDGYLDAVIEKEVTSTYVDDYWETVEDRDNWPWVNPGEIHFTLEDVMSMRGKDDDDLKKAIKARARASVKKNPFDLDLSDTGGLEEGMPYWPGTPFLSHAGIIVVEEVNSKKRAFVYDAYPGEGIMRKPLARFFGTAEAVMGAIFRYNGDKVKVPGLAAGEVVDLYRKRWNKKKLRIRPQTGETATEILLDEKEASPPDNRAQAWDSFDYAFDWRNQTRYSCSELVWAHYARNGVSLCDCFSMLLAPVEVARDQLGWGVEVMIQASPQALLLCDRLDRIIDFEAEPFDAHLKAYDRSGEAQELRREDMEKNGIPTVCFDFKGD